jgi:hypothetical protein
MLKPDIAEFELEPTFIDQINNKTMLVQHKLGNPNSKRSNR